jgi:hypothetical protein
MVHSLSAAAGVTGGNATGTLAALSSRLQQRACHGAHSIHSMLEAIHLRGVRLTVLRSSGTCWRRLAGSWGRTSALVRRTITAAHSSRFSSPRLLEPGPQIGIEDILEKVREFENTAAAHSSRFSSPRLLDPGV